MHSFSVRIDVSSSFGMIPHRSEENSHSGWIRLMAQIYSEWYRAIPCSVRMIPCHYALSPNNSIAHSNGLDSEWFGNRFGIHTESFSIQWVRNLCLVGCKSVENLSDLIRVNPRLWIRMNQFFNANESEVGIFRIDSDWEFNLNHSDLGFIRI